MRDLPISNWIRELQEAIRAAEQMIAPLRQLDKRTWADELVREIKMMNEAVAALQRIGSHRSKRLGRPPKWLHERSESGESEAP